MRVLVFSENNIAITSHNEGISFLDTGVSHFVNLSPRYNNSSLQ